MEYETDFAVIKAATVEEAIEIFLKTCVCTRSEIHTTYDITPIIAQDEAEVRDIYSDYIVEYVLPMEAEPEGTEPSPYISGGEVIYPYPSGAPEQEIPF